MKTISFFCLVSCLFASVSLASEHLEDMILIGHFWVEINPDNPENAWYPEYARENIFWVLERFRSKELSLELVYFPNTPPYFMAARYSEDDKAIIRVVPDELKNLLWLGLMSGLDINEFGKNIFMIGIVHEAEHLRWRHELHSCEDYFKEEARVWRTVNELLVSKMITECRMVSPSLIELQKILDNEGKESQRFKDFIKEKVHCSE